MKLSKKKKVIILIILLLVVFRFVTNKTTKVKVEEYIENKDFRLNSETNLYEKRTSEINIKEYYSLTENLRDADYSVLYFDTKTFAVLKDKMSYSKGITSIFNGTYDYRTAKLTYVYEISKDNTVIMFKGEMFDDEFSCDITYSNNIDISSNKMTFCKNIEYEAEDFEDEIRNLITDPGLLEKIKEEN